MSSFIISTDGTCDLPQELISKYPDLVIIPQDFSIAGKNYSYFGENCLPIEQFYQLLDAGELASTSQVSLDRFESYWRPILESGKDILHISFASALSGSYNNSTVVAKQLMEEFPDRKIVSIDSANATIAIGFLTMLALEKRNEGAEFDQTVEYVSALADRIHTYFTVNSLNHLLRMGRLSKTYATLGNTLQIKPLIAISHAGELKPFDKAIGRKNAFKRLAQMYAEKYDPAEKTVFVGHSGDISGVEFLESKIKETNPNATVIRTYVGAIAGSHAGSGVTLVCFKSKIEKPII